MLKGPVDELDNMKPETPIKAESPSLPMTVKQWKAKRKPMQNSATAHKEKLSLLDKLACSITAKVGTMAFFLLILVWTILWTGYNILASTVPGLHWPPFDPFPAFVAYLLISNVIQILLMPLIMVGQNVQGHFSDVRAEHDLEVNVKAEQEIEVVLTHLEYQNGLLLKLLEQQGTKLDAAIESSKLDK